ncbi:interferon-inducible GTPase 5-like [Haplochromis burtoni]|uniref:interferon-inducible GTPase 5-like n=1 Tax=Haplochromis burtoni TaxID=8153 RepID=UPI0003BD9741|nr:interferon-inducible GTPase 5-like [Haplochromis burtoni]
MNDPIGVKSVIENYDTAAAAAKIKKKYLKKTRNIPLNIAVTGESGAGKSTFVNAFRGLTDEDDEAAPAYGDSTSEVAAYKHPDYPNVTLWDLPGIGTPMFPAEKYLKRVEFRMFYFFIIVSRTRITENDVKLALKIQEMGKKFYFVRSKIDKDLRAERRKRNFSKERTLTKIREDCAQGLQAHGIKCSKVFLVSSFKPRKYDFSLLHETLERQLPKLKRNAFVLAMPNISLEIIKKKKQAMDLRLPNVACFGRPNVSVPGLTVSVNLPWLHIIIVMVVDAFGLDIPSLWKLAASTGLSYSDLCAVIKSPLAAAEITEKLLLKVLNQVGVTSELRFELSMINFLESVVGSIPRGRCYRVMEKAMPIILRELADDAQRVFQRVLA